MTKPSNNFHTPLEQEETPLFDALLDYQAKAPAYFRIPGHRFERGINRKWIDFAGKNIFRMDLTETPLLDDLHNPTGPILKAELLAAELFGALKSYFLVNGTTCGNQAMILASVKEGQEILIPRNSHKSVLSGLILSGARPVYIMPGISPKAGVLGGLCLGEVSQALDRNPGIKAALAVRPTYHGLCTDLKGLAELCHKRGISLLVDEAHGAHLYFCEKLPAGALSSGADACSQSIHKVTGSLTQSSMLHLGSPRLDQALLESSLHLVQSTSPSYLLMVSLDLARQDLALSGKDNIERALNLAEELRQRINRIPGIHCFGRELAGEAGIEETDPTRLILSAGALGLTGFDLKKRLFDEYSLDLELADWFTVLAIVTYANNQEDGERLISALSDISKQEMEMGVRVTKPLGQGIPGGIPGGKAVFFPSLPPQRLTPREAFFSSYETIPWRESRERTAAEMIAPYPPGIPVLYPGEIVTEEIWEYLEPFRREGRHLQGPADGTLGSIRVILED